MKIKITLDKAITDYINIADEEHLCIENYPSDNIVELEGIWYCIEELDEGNANGEPMAEVEKIENCPYCGEILD